VSSPQLGARARNTDPQTSHAAAAAIDAEGITAALQLAVLDMLLRHRDGLTAREIGELLGVELGSITPRMVALEDLHLIRRTDHKRVSAVTGRGRAGIVWIALK
jgi:DNA-binding MarR family transcriptional regulator